MYPITHCLKTELLSSKRCPPGRASLINMWRMALKLSVLLSWLTVSLTLTLGPGLKSVGSIAGLGTRLIPAANFETDEGLDAVYEMLKGFVSITSPEIILGTPWLYNHTEGSTSVTPAWRNSIWHVRRLPSTMPL